jgi:hypothetical protein
MDEKDERGAREEWRERRREYKEERREQHDEDDFISPYHRRAYRGWRDPVGGVALGLLIIWLGVTFYLKYTGVLPESNWWAYMLAGFGVIWLLGGLVRLFWPRWSYRALGMLIPGIIVGAIGMMFIAGSFQFWPLILIAAGLAVIVVVIVRAIWRSSRKEE